MSLHEAFLVTHPVTGELLRVRVLTEKSEAKREILKHLDQHPWIALSGSFLEETPNDKAPSLWTWWRCVDRSPTKRIFEATPLTLFPGDPLIYASNAMHSLGCGRPCSTAFGHLLMSASVADRAKVTAHLRECSKALLFLKELRLYPNNHFGYALDPLLEEFP